MKLGYKIAIGLGAAILIGGGIYLAVRASKKEDEPTQGNNTNTGGTNQSVKNSAMDAVSKNNNASTGWSGIEHNNYLMNIINRMATEKVYTSGETLFNDASKEFLAKRKADNSI